MPFPEIIVTRPKNIVLTLKDQAEVDSCFLIDTSLQCRAFQVTLCKQMVTGSQQALMVIGEGKQRLTNAFPKWNNPMNQ